MKNDKDREEYVFSAKLTKKNLLLMIAYTVALVVLFLNFSSSLRVLSKIMRIVSPFIMGFAFAFLLNIPMTFFEKKVFLFMEKKNGKVWKKIKRPVCFIVTVAILYIVVSTIGKFIYGEVLECISDFAENASSYAWHFQNMINSFAEKFSDGFLLEQIEKINLVSLIEKAASALATVSPNLVNITLGFTNAVFNFFMAVIFMIYLLFGKERILRHIRKIMYAYLKRPTAEMLRSTAALTAKTFTQFTVGQLTETLILMLMYFIGTNAAHMPYPALISVLMGIGGIIPVLGPVITAVPSVILIVMVGGINDAVIFVIMAVIFQQIESNIIYPKVIGESIGLPGIWVLFSVLVGSAAGGMVGMIVAVPAASVVYKLLRKDVNKRVYEKGISEEELQPSDVRMGGFETENGKNTQHERNETDGKSENKSDIAPKEK